MLISLHLQINYLQDEVSFVLGLITAVPSWGKSVINILSNSLFKNTIQGQTK